MCLFESAVFEVDTSLRWIPWQSKLMSATCITKPKKKEKNCQGLGYMRSRGWGPHNGISTLIKRPKEQGSLSYMWWPSKKAAFCHPGRGPSPDTEFEDTLILDFLTPRTVRSKCLPFKLPSWRYFVMEAKAETHTHTPTLLYHVHINSPYNTYVYTCTHMHTDTYLNIPYCGYIHTTLHTAHLHMPPPSPSHTYIALNTMPLIHTNFLYSPSMRCPLYHLSGFDSRCCLYMEQFPVTLFIWLILPHPSVLTLDGASCRKPFWCLTSPFSYPNWLRSSGVLQLFCTGFQDLNIFIISFSENMLVTRNWLESLDHRNWQTLQWGRGVCFDLPFW